MNTRFHDIAARVVDLLLDVVCVVDLKGHFVYISAACEKVFGYTQSEMLGSNMINYVHPDDREKTLAVAAEVMRGNEQPYFENRYIRKDGRTVNIMWSARWSEDESVRIAVARDITAYKRYERIQSAIYQISQEAHKASELSTLYQNAHQIMKRFIAADVCVVAIKDEYEQEITLAYCSDGQSQLQTAINQTHKNAIGRVVESGNSLLLQTAEEHAQLAEVDDELTILNKGNWLAVPLIIQGKIIGALVIQSKQEIAYTRDDIKPMEFVAELIVVTIERKENEKKLNHIATHDWLTGLPNRLLFNDRVDVAIKRAARLGEKLTLMYMDLNGFKSVNDSLGHSKGDLLLSKVAKRLQACVRSSDTVARMGGDEFTILLNEVGDQSSIDLVCDKVKESMNKVFVLDHHSVNIGISIGVATYPEHGQDGEQLFRFADNAMYYDKRQNSDN